MTGASATKVSVVIPVGSDLEHFDAQLRAIARQDYSGHLELVLSCNGIQIPALRDAHSVILDNGKWSVLLVDSSATRGPSHARNVGWQTATSDIILFCDADDVASPGWVTAMVRALETSSLCGGALEFEKLNAPGVGTWGAVAVTDLPRKFSHLAFVPSGNFGARKHVLAELSGFDESLDRSEDVDFSWRAQYAGHSIRFAPEGVVSVRRRATSRGLVRQASEDAAHDPALLALHYRYGARWKLSDTVREAAGVTVALIQSPIGAGNRAKLATRSGRFFGHLRASPSFLRIHRQGLALEISGEVSGQ